MNRAFPEPANCLLVLVDVQERLCAAMGDFEPVRAAIEKLLRGAVLLETPAVVTEQYPQGLGPTLPGLKSLLPAATPVFAKTSFSCFGAVDFAAAVDARRPQALVLAGMETHVCVQQTAVAAMNRGCQVILPRDAVVSRKPADRDAAIELLRQRGAAITTVESLLFDWLQNAKHPQFKAVSALMR